MVAGRCRDPEGDDSEEEPEAQAEEAGDEPPEIKLLKSVLMASSKPRPELSNYDGSLSTETFLN